LNSYMLKIVDNRGCIVTGVEPVITCP
jgi:hypothetical protein